MGYAPGLYLTVRTFLVDIAVGVVAPPAVVVGNSELPAAVGSFVLPAVVVGNSELPAAVGSFVLPV